jgi:hypothetical protein
MSGGILQLVGKGAQDQLIVGSPKLSHFTNMYKRHTDFAMEHFRLSFRSSNLNLPSNGSVRLSAKVERYAQLVHDCYLSVTLPNIYSPVVPVTAGLNTRLNGTATGIGYEFQWVKNIGYNMINYVAVLVNGQEIVRHTGEWMKLYAELKFTANKKKLLDKMVGNIVDMYDPANSGDRLNQYPHSIPTSSTLAEPSIKGRTLTIPLHFWFCETVGAALPLVALQYSEVEIVVDLKNMYQLFTTLNVQDGNSSCGLRVAPDSSSNVYNIQHFLASPSYANSTIPTTVLFSWNLNPFIEANYIFLTDEEGAIIATTNQSFVIRQLDIKETHGQYGPSNDLELTMKNLCTRIVWVAQRSDRALQNDYDNYTNWVDVDKRPSTVTGMSFMTPSYSSGNELASNVNQRDILIESALVLDGKERFPFKQTEFFNGVEHYKHSTGKLSIDGIYEYSFALNPMDDIQPSGHINGSQFNRTILRNTYVYPALTGTATGTVVCVLKSTANNANPTIVNPLAVDQFGRLLYSSDEVVTIIRKSDAQTLSYTFNVRAFVESYNFLRIMGGMANLAFSS